MSNFSKMFLEETTNIVSQIDDKDIESVVDCLQNVVCVGGRLFILGCGGSAGTASHAVNDFRKICKIETYSPVDNISELTARVNDEGWETTFVEWLKGSRLNNNDAILILSVGGGNASRQVSVNLIKAIDYAKQVNAQIIGIVGRDGGYTKQMANACVLIPPLVSERITPHTESLASVILHLIVSHPNLKMIQTKWESTK
jgi:D-sedoheptulose 7-phosphate isomerase